MNSSTPTAHSHSAPQHPNRVQQLQDALGISAFNGRDSKGHSDSDGSYAIDAIDNLKELDDIHGLNNIHGLNDIHSLNDMANSDIKQRPSAATELSLQDFFAGLTQLATTSVIETSEIIEAIHREVILRPIGRFDKQHIRRWQQGIPGQLYHGLRRLTLMLGQGLSMGAIQYSLLPKLKQPIALPDTLKLFVSILNGVLGDHLVSNQNALALPMQFYKGDGKVYRYAPAQQSLSLTEPATSKKLAQSAQPLASAIKADAVEADSEQISGRVVVLIHGLCMSHAYWHSADKKGQKNKKKQQQKLGLGDKIVQHNRQTTVLYLDYNTGQRISSNGRLLSQLLQDLVEQQPNISQIDFIGHSMGGLVARSALFYGQQSGASWVQRLQKLITLGTPHHGSALERIGFLVQGAIAKLPFAGALAKLGDIRSAGIIDLRHGSIRDEDWQALEPRSVLPDSFRHPTDLPADIHAYFIAGTLIENLYGFSASHLLGDGLVTVASALGEHTEEHTLYVPDGHKAIFYGINHQQLIYDDRVHKKIIAWLDDDGSQALEPRYHSYIENFVIAF